MNPKATSNTSLDIPRVPLLGASLKIYRFLELNPGKGYTKTELYKKLGYSSSTIRQAIRYVNRHPSIYSQKRLNDGEREYLWRDE